MASTINRDQLVAAVESGLVTRVEGDGLVVGRDADRILVFAPGGPFFAITVEELSLTPKRAARKKATT